VNIPVELELKNLGDASDCQTQNGSIVIVKVPLRNGSDEIYPITSHTVHHGPCSGLAFLSTMDIVTVAWGGDIKYWQFCRGE